MKTIKLLFASLLICALTTLGACGGGREKTPDPVIDAPSGLSVGLVAAHRVELSWLASSNAAKYQVVRNGESPPIGETTQARYVDTAVAANTTYSYEIKAVDGAGHISNPSVRVSATTLADADTTPPTVPTQLTATASSSTRVELAWSASTDNVGVAKYQIFRDGAALPMAEAAGLAYADITAVGGGSYTYQVKAVDAAGNVSATSNAATVTTPPAADTVPPTAPTGLTASVVGATRVDLSWTASTDAVGVAKYRIYRNGSSAALAETTSTSYSDASVLAGTAYTYQVKALDAANNMSTASGAASATTPATPDTTAPSAPAALAASAVSPTRISLTWNASTDNIGVVKYQVFRNGSTTALAEPTGAGYSDTTVTASTAYTYQVRAVDAANNVSVLSNTASATTPAAPDATPPTAPGSLAAVAAGSGRINLSWMASTDNVGVTQYRVFRDGASAALAETAGTSYADTSVVGNTTYAYQVVATDAAGNMSDRSNTATAATPAAADTTPPTIPGNLSATATSATRVELSWTASTDAVGVAKYRVFRDGSATALAETAGTSYVDTSVAASTTYTYRVSAVDAANNASALSGSATVNTSRVLVWSDEFNGAAGTALDASKWTHEVGGGGWGNKEFEYYTNSTNNAAMDGAGHLVITARKLSPADAPLSCWYGACLYTSARIVTKGKFSTQFGRIEARIKIPQGQGMWPAFWMIGDNIDSVGWPASGEIDILENIGNEPATAHGTLHGGNPHYSVGGSYKLPAGNLYDDYHLYAIEWAAGVVRWYVDGNLYKTVSTADIPSGANWVFDHPFYVILNVAVGGSWPGSPDASTVFPQQMLVDYVRAYR